jgi:hypothetical protein
VEAGLWPRYGWGVEDRSIWLPAGVESSRLEPDDRASQRPGKGPNRGPSAAGGRDPYDQERPESKRGRGTPDSGEGRKPQLAAKKTDQTWTEVEETKAKDEARKPKVDEARKPKTKAKPDEAPKARADDPPKARAAPRREQRSPEERSDVDAMGQDKHRQVVGQRFGASRARQFAYYGIFVAFVIGAYLGLKTAADQLDKAPAHDTDQAPWSKPDAPQGPLGGFDTPGHKGPTRFQ